MSNVGSSGLSSASTDSCGSSTDSCNNRTSSNVYSDQSRSAKSFSISSLARKNNKIGISQEARSLFGISSRIPGLGVHGVENPIFNLPGSLPNNLSARYYSSHSNNSSSAPPNSCNKSDPDSAIASDASSAETCNVNSQTSNHLHSHSHQQIRSISASPRSSGSQDEAVIDLTRKHNQHNHNTLNTLNTLNRNGMENGSKSSGSRSVSPPPPPSITCTGTLGGGTASRISVIKWPQGSIPRRVKKLTWEDETMGYNTIINYGNIDRHNRSLSNGNELMNGHHDNCYDDQLNNYDYSQSYMRSPSGHSRTELDPDLSVAPYRRTYSHPLNANESKSNLPDLTVYF